MSDLIETLASYVPALISRRLAVDPTPIHAPVSETFPAAVLFTDISGFTALTERLARQGPVGAEELSQLLNAYFSQLINLIVMHGGDVVKFAGDALLALWPAINENGRPDPARLAAATRQAAHCGLLARDQLNDYPVTPEIRLSIKLTLGAGEILTMHLGGEYGRWEFLVTGAPLVQVGQAAAYAQAGDVLLSPEAWAQVEAIAAVAPALSPAPEGEKTVPNRHRGVIRLQALRLPAPASETAAGQNTPALPPAVEAGLRAYIPGAVLTRLAALQTDWLAELRRVTILFVNLPNLNYAIPLEQAQSLMRTLQQEVYRYEGSINKLGVDDKGVTLVAAMGLPPLSHPDDPERGVRAAMTIQARLRQLGVKGAIGVTTGRVFCGSIGNDLRREYTMNGDVVNLAARLMQAATNDILCDAVTYQAAWASLAFEPLPPIKVKGKAEPVAIYRPLGEKEGTIRRETIIIGREAERDRLEEYLQTLLRGGGGVILIEGETGMGKSRLVDDLLHQAETLGITRLVGGGDSIDKSTPYHAWRPIFKDIFKLETVPDDPAAQRAHILTQLQTELVPAQTPIAENREPGAASQVDHWLRLAPLLKAVLPLEWPENELTAQLSGKVRADNTHELLVHLLQQAVWRGQAAGQPYLLVFDDAHWLDSASWALAQLVAQQVQPLLLVIVTRPMTDPIPPEYSQLRGDSKTGLITLARLSLNDTAAFVSECLEVNSLPESLAEFIYSKADGNPLFSEELTYALRDAGFITVSDGQCRLASNLAGLHDLRLPETVQGVITGRIDRLTPSQQLTLKVASVIGRVFEYDTLRAVHPIEADKIRLPEYLDTLDRLDITQLEEPEPDLAYIFKQMTTQEVAYNMMLFSQRRELHRSVAAWYERTYAEDLSPFYSLLAYHWRAADVPAAAIEYLEKAGEQALHNYANEEAIEFFGEALALADRLRATAVSPPPQRRGQWEIKLGEAYVNWAKLSEGQAHFERGLALLGYPVPTGAVRLALSLAYQVSRQVICRTWPICRVGQRAADKETLLAAARAYEGLTAVYYFANKTLLTLYSAYRSLNLAEEAGPSPQLARGYASVGVINSFIPIHRSAEAYCRRARAMAQQIDNLPALAWVSLLSGVYYAGVGRWANAQEWLEQVIDLAQRLGDRSRGDDGVGNLAMVNYFCGRFSQSAQLYDDLLASAARRQDAHNQAWALRGQVYCLLVQGEFHEALARLQTIQDILAQNTHIVDEALNIDLHGLLALVHLRRGEAAPALAAADHALHLMAQTSPTSFLSLPGYAGVVETFLTLWEADPGNSRLKEAARCAGRALRSYTRVFPIGQPQAWLWQGVFEWLSGRPARARKLWLKSRQAARRLDMPYVEGLAHDALGRHLPPGDPGRAEHLAQARAIFARLEAGDNLQRTQKEIQL
ncbi:MAG: AAA family ATPase [Chloroflexota bacterium]